MSSFHITCTTCHSRLKVKDTSAIGLILSCPRCGSMVMVSAPDPQEASGADAPPPADTHAAADAEPPVAAPPPDSSLDPSGPRQTVSDSMQETVDGDFDIPRELIDNAAATPPAARLADSSAVTAELGSPDEFDEASAPDSAHEDGKPAAVDSGTRGEPLLPDSQWISQETRQMRQWLLTGAAMVFGVLAAVGLVVFMVSRQSRVSVAQGPDVAAEQRRVDDDLATGGSTAPPAPEDTQAEDADTADPVEPLKPVAPAPGVDSGDSVEPGDGTETPISQTPDPQTPDPQTPDPEIIGPLGPEPPGLEPADSGPARLDAAGSELLGEFKGELADLERMLEEEETDRIAPSMEDPDRAGSYDQLRAELAVVRHPSPIRVDAPARLADPLEQVQLEAVTLKQLARFVTELTTVPVTLDADALFHVGASPTSRVSCQLTDGDALGVLTTALAPLRLAPRVEASHVIISHLGGAAPVSTRLEAADLAADAEQQQWLLDLVHHTVAPGSWAPDGPGQLAWQADGTLAVKHTREALFDVLHLLESLRTARELPLKSGGPPERFELGPRRTRALPGLAKPTNANFDDPAPLHQVLDKLTEQTGVEILVDWQAVESQRWNPQGEMTLTTVDESLAAALRMLLIPMQLDYYVVDADLLVISSPDAVAARHELALYPARDLIADDADPSLAIEQLQTALGPDAFAPDTGNLLRFDEPSRTLIARLPPAGHRALQRLLDLERQ